MRIFAGAGAMALGVRAHAEKDHARWRGTLFGAPVDIQIVDTGDGIAGRALTAAVTRLRVLEAALDLQNPASAICRLNAQGHLSAPDPDLRFLLELSGRLHQASGGHFDPTVQLLWRLYSDHFEKHPTSETGPADALLADNRALMGFDQVHVESKAVRFAQAGMAVTLNGVAQGYVADEIASVFTGFGLDAALINMGEYRGLGRHESGRPWRLAVPHPTQPWRTIRVIDLPPGSALATSAGAGTPLSTNGQHHHLFNPRSAASAHSWASVSVIAGCATIADGLSTTLAVSPVEQAETILKSFNGTRAVGLTSQGELVDLGGGA